MSHASTSQQRFGPPRSLSREQIAATGLEILQQEGLGAVSLRTVAMRLGVDHKALYTYIPNKDQLLAAIFDAAWATLTLPAPDDRRPAEDQLVEIFSSIRRLLLANSDLLRLVRPATVSGMDLRYFEVIWAQLALVAQDDATAARLYLRLLTATMGSAYISQLPSPDSRPGAQDPERLNPDAYAVLKPIVAAFSDIDHEELFVQSLRDILRRP